MSNPDIKITGVKMPSVNALYIAFPISILFVLMTITLFYLKKSIPQSSAVCLRIGVHSQGRLASLYTS